MGRPKKHVETKSKSMRIDTSVIEFLEKISGEKNCTGGLHLICKAAMAWQDLPTLAIEEANFIADTLNGYMALNEDPRLIKHELEDAYNFGQGKRFEVHEDFVDEVKSWSIEECKALKGAASAFWGMALIDCEAHTSQFFKIK